jgi:hypothetical protein
MSIPLVDPVSPLPSDQEDTQELQEMRRAFDEFNAWAVG